MTIIIICNLTNVDVWTVAKYMRSLGYGVVETEGSADGRNGRIDSCGLYFREDYWECLEHETVYLDDLAILRSSAERETSTQNGVTKSKKLNGFEHTFVRKNVSILAKMQHKPSRRQMAIVVSHLYWNPAYDYVKVRAHIVVCYGAFFAIILQLFLTPNDYPI